MFHYCIISTYYFYKISLPSDETIIFIVVDTKIINITVFYFVTELLTSHAGKLK